MLGSLGLPSTTQANLEYGGGGLMCGVWGIRVQDLGFVPSDSDFKGE